MPCPFSCSWPSRCRPRRVRSGPSRGQEASCGDQKSAADYDRSMAIETGRLSWLRVPAPEEVTAGAKALWEQPLERLGFVPNVLRAYALRPRHLELWWAFYDELMRGESGLTKAQREMIALVVSAANRCHHCIVSHSAARRKLTGDPVLVEQLATNYAYAEVAPRSGRCSTSRSSSPSSRLAAARQTSRRSGRRAGATRRSWTSPRWRRCSTSRTGWRAASA